MAIINKIENIAKIQYGEDTIQSLPAETVLLLPPLIVKAVDKLVASIGEVLTYTVTITNVAIGAISNLPFSDVIPEGSTYVVDSFKLNGSTVTPTITDNTLNYTIPSIPGLLGTAVIQFQVTVVGGEP